MSKYNKVLFFVYGTLMDGYHNHHYLGNAIFKGDFKTDASYTLFDGGYPVVERGGETAINGELWWSEDPEAIQDTFDLEGCSSQVQGHPRNWYDFDKIDTPFGEAVMFCMNKGKSDRTVKLKSGTWRQK